MYYLHIIRDDKFTDHVISTFEDIAPDQSIYLLVTDKKTITYVKNINKITHVNNRTVNYKKILRSIPNLKAVFVNYFYHEQYDLLLSLDKSIKVFWFIYGGDLYGQIYTLEQLLEPLTYQFYIHHQPILQKIKNRIRPFITDFSPSIYKKNKCIKRIDYCSAIVDTEFDLLKKIKGFRAKQVYFNYGSLETLLGAFSEQTVQGDNILVGNSNTLTSNHVDAFKKLADLTLGDRKIIVPLNYGNDDLYKKKKKT